ncbi:hypothetical protein [Tsukamurella sp. 1534]|uniref:hypothetical protein n=1 Tax=Tsukamurella sp. 1534 TaxID=1151061 RepID=UPI0002E08FE1|nr:hypothetical protein [Tsukamurella sp. 1534]
MSTHRIPRTVLAAAGGLAVLGGVVLGAGSAAAAPAPGPAQPTAVCGTTGLDGSPSRTVPCSEIPAAATSDGARFTLDADGTIRDAAGKVVGRAAVPAGAPGAVKVVEVRAPHSEPVGR